MSLVPIKKSLKRNLCVILTFLLLFSLLPAAGGLAQEEEENISGNLWGWGNNAFGQLGDGTTSSKRTPTEVASSVLEEGTAWAAVTTGSDHTMALDTDGILWAWGLNSLGQLGDGTTTHKNTPTLVTSVLGEGTAWAAVTAGHRHTVALDTDGNLWSWGHNQYGQLGDGTFEDRLTPTLVASVLKEGTTWVTIAAGLNYTMALDTEGNLWGWGHNQYGQLGDGTTYNSKNTPTEVNSSDLGEGTAWVAVTAGGGNHTFALDTDGNLWAWGANWSGQLGDGTTTNRRLPTAVDSSILQEGTTWATVTAGANSTAALDTDGKLWAWGQNDVGQLGDGTYDDKLTPTPVASVLEEGISWTTVTAGHFHTMALDTTGNLWAWGSNADGKLGIGTYDSNKHTPTQVASVLEEGTSWAAVSAGRAHTLAIAEIEAEPVVGTPNLYAWDVNNFGQLGDGTNENKEHPTPIGNADDWAVIAAGYQHTVALKEDGSLWTWGRNQHGQLGDGSTTDTNTPNQVGEDNDWSVIATSWEHTLAIKEDGSLYGWGSNRNGQLATGSYTAGTTTPTRIGDDTDWAAIAAGSEYSVALKTDGSLYAWGKNDLGQLGDGTTSWKTTPTLIGSDTDWATIAAGRSHTMALKTDGSLYGWGSNGSGQLGDGTTSNKNTPTFIGNGWGKVNVGHFHTIALKTDGSLYTWGRGDSGQLGDGTNENKNTPTLISSDIWSAIDGGWHQTVVVKGDGSLWYTGRTYYEVSWTLYQVGTTTDWTTVSVGDRFVLALTSDIEIEPALVSVTFSVMAGEGSLSAQADGEDISSGDDVVQGSTVVFTATPDTGNQVKDWFVDGTAIDSTDSTYTIDDLQATVDVKVEFEAIPATTFNVTFGVEAGEGNLTAQADGEDISSGDDVVEGSTVVFTATPNEGYQVKAWVVDTVALDSTDATYTIIDLQAAADVTVEFEAIPITTYTVTYSIEGEVENGTLGAKVDSIAINSGDAVEEGKDVVFTAVPDPGFQVKEWTVNGTVQADETGNEFILEDLQEAVVVQVVFEEDPLEEITLESLRGLVEDLIIDDTLNSGQGRALLATLAATDKLINSGNVEAAGNLLQAFINQVEAGGNLQEDEGQELIAAAQYFIEQLYVDEG